MSTISTEERREVARRLRELADYCDENEMSLSDDDWPGILSDYIWPEDGGYHIYDDDCRRLADLIDPKGIESEAFKPVESDGFDRDALLALAGELDSEGLDGWASGPVGTGRYARRIREALGVSE